ncbi:MAG: DUF305 domain-containing protein [Pseudomonadota bacterium]|nr:DUF305 domain-containing protein [Pseudomonadota bacterium]
MKHQQEQQRDQMMSMSWLKFAGMIAASVAAMFVLMYQLVYSWDHATFSLNRLVSSFVMGSVMVLLMLGFMWGMLKGAALKMGLLAGAIVVGIGILAINRDQTLIGDEDFMKSMIPHHSIAINNARKSDIRDPRVQRLANEIIEAQVREIAEMKWLLEEIDRNGRLGNETLPRVPAVLTPEMRAKIDQNIESATPPTARR